MPVPVHLDDVNDALKPWLGALFLMSTPLSQELSYQMMQYSPVRETFEQLRQRLEQYILVADQQADAFKHVYHGGELSNQAAVASGYRVYDRRPDGPDV